MRISTKPFYKLFSVVHNNFQWMCLISERIYDDRILENVPKNLENLRKTWNLKMRISTQSFYKLFCVVHNYLLWMFLIIERKYVDRIPPKCPKKLRKMCEKKENLKMRISTERFYKLFSVVHNYFLSMFLFIERIYDDRYMMIVSLQNASDNLEKLREKEENLKKPISTKPFYKLFSTVHNYFLWMFLIIERIYDDRIHPKCPQKLRKCATNEKLKMRISTKPFYKLFSVVHNNVQWMCLISERIYDDRIPRKCSKT